MVTTKIEIKKHLAEYVHGKYNDCMPGPVFLPDREDLYHVVYDLLERRPVSCLPDRYPGQAYRKITGYIQLSGSTFLPDHLPEDRSIVLGRTTQFN